MTRPGRLADGGPLQLRQIPYDPATWREVVATYPTAEVFHSPEWLAYLERYRGVVPIVAEVLQGPEVVGHFAGAVSRQFGLPVLGSPRSGWGTNNMGFLLQPEVSRVEATRSLLEFAYGQLGCVHVELWDRRLRAGDVGSLPYSLTTRETTEVDLSGSESDILSRMRSRTRTYVRRAERVGLHVEEISGADFADEYYRQLTDVFDSSALVPTYGVDRVRVLIECVGPSGQLLMLMVRDDDGRPIASIITVGRNERSLLWGLAWYREAAKLHPVERIQWEAMRLWRERGASVYDLDGPGLGKAKFGGRPRIEAHLHHSRYPVLDAGRSVARTLFYGRQRIVGRIRALRG